MPLCSNSAQGVQGTVIRKRDRHRILKATRPGKPRLCGKDWCRQRRGSETGGNGCPQQYAPGLGEGSPEKVGVLIASGSNNGTVIGSKGRGRPGKPKVSVRVPPGG